MYIYAEQIMILPLFVLNKMTEIILHNAHAETICEAAVSCNYQFQVTAL